MSSVKHKRFLMRVCSVVAAVVVTFAAISATDDLKFGNNIRILANIFRELHLSYVDDVDSEELLMAAADAMTSKLDPYTDFIPASEVPDFEFMTTGKYGGIGALIHTSGDYTMISEPYKDTPADLAGLKAGDMILAVDGESIKNYDSSKVSGMMKGLAGTNVTLTIRRLLDSQEVDVDIIRDRIVVSGVRYYGMVADDVGYIMHDQFTENCSNDIKAALEELKAQGAESLIIDLRGNGGGILQEAVKIVSMFVPKGTEVVRMMGRSRRSQEIFTTSTEPLDLEMPLVVLVNSSSASASEIVSGSLQDLDRAVLVGDRTFGKGLVQSTASVGSDSYLKLTTAKYYIPSGRCIQAIDYAQRDENGAVSHVPDSLIQEFKTAAGRTVYDGGGIIPDLKVERETISSFTSNLYSLGHVENFANDYYRRNHEHSVEPSSFTLSDQEYTNFGNMLEESDVRFRSRSTVLLDQLRKEIATQNVADSCTLELDAIEAKISPDKQSGLDLYKKEITRLLENEIVRRYCYAVGAAEHSLREDIQLSEALEILADKERYTEILSNTETAAKQE